MYLRSPSPPVPDILPTNFHHLVFPDAIFEGQMDGQNYTIHIDAITGQQRTVVEFVKDVYDAITAFGLGKIQYGGLELDGQQHRVGILSDNCMEYITIVHSLIGLAVPFVPLSPLETQWELSSYLKKTNVTHVLVHKTYFSRLYSASADLRAQLPDKNIVLFEGNSTVELTDTEKENIKRFRSFRDLIQMVRLNLLHQEPIRPVKSDTVAYFICSSGTSGRPKAIMISHKNLYHSVIADSFLERGQSVLPTTSLCFLPFYHSYGLVFACLRSIPKSRGSFVIMPRWDSDLALKQIPKHRINILTVVPSIVSTILSSSKYKEIDTSSINTILSGAAHLPKHMEMQLRSVFPNAEIIQGQRTACLTLLKRIHAISSYTLIMAAYGLSESTAAAIRSSTLMHGNTAVLNSGYEAMILRPDGTHCLPNEPGELYLKGNCIALGYWRDPEATAKTFLSSGWCRTGDIFSADSEGNFYFKDRAKDILKVSGLQVSPSDIEDVIHAEPSGLVQDAVVAGVLLSESEGTGTSRFEDEKSPRAWIVLSEKGKQLGEENVRKVIDDWVKEKLSRYKWLRGGIEFVDQIPKNYMGKVPRKVLQDEYEDRHRDVRTKL